MLAPANYCFLHHNSVFCLFTALEKVAQCIFSVDHVYHLSLVCLHAYICKLALNTNKKTDLMMMVIYMKAPLLLVFTTSEVEIFGKFQSHAHNFPCCKYESYLTSSIHKSLKTFAYLCLWRSYVEP